MKTRKSKVKVIKAYETTDGKVFTGKNAPEESEKHQKSLNMRKLAKEIVAQSRIILDVPIDEDGDGETNESQFIENMCDNLNVDFEDFEEFMSFMLDLYALEPKLVEIFQLIRRYHEDI